MMNLLHDNNVFRNFLLEENSCLIHASQLTHYAGITPKSKFHVPVACCDKRKISSLARFGKLNKEKGLESEEGLQSAKRNGFTNLFHEPNVLCIVRGNRPLEYYGCKVKVLSALYVDKTQNSAQNPVTITVSTPSPLNFSARPVFVKEFP